MLRASVSLSRKVSHDFNSSGYTVTLDGEVPTRLTTPRPSWKRFRNCSNSPRKPSPPRSNGTEAVCPVHNPKRHPGHRSRRVVAVNRSR